MNVRWVLDPKLGSRLRAVIVVVSGVLTALGQTLDQLDAAKWTFSVPTVLALLAHWTPVGSQKQ